MQNDCEEEWAEGQPSCAAGIYRTPMTREKWGAGHRPALQEHAANKCLENNGLQDSCPVLQESAGRK